MKRFKAYEPEQGYLLPPSVAEWLPSDHLVYFLSEVVDSLDLTAIYSSYADGVGQPPYPPRMMVQVWLYGYCRGIVLLLAASLALIDLILLRMAVRLFPRETRPHPVAVGHATPLPCPPPGCELPASCLICGPRVRTLKKQERGRPTWTPSK